MNIFTTVLCTASRVIGSQTGRMGEKTTEETRLGFRRRQAKRNVTIVLQVITVSNICCDRIWCFRRESARQFRNIISNSQNHRVNK